jgi:hypothetical protein
MGADMSSMVGSCKKDTSSAGSNMKNIVPSAPSVNNTGVPANNSSKNVGANNSKKNAGNVKTSSANDGSSNAGNVKTSSANDGSSNAGDPTAPATAPANAGDPTNTTAPANASVTEPTPATIGGRRKSKKHSRKMKKRSRKSNRSRSK